jgi:predicted alpha/beta hydrolase
MNSSPLKFPALDGFELAGTLYEPSAELDRGKTVLLASATAVRRRYYHGFARHLADRGLTVLTFDYRGIGDSRPASLKGFRASMRDWGTSDLAGAIAWLTARYPGRPLVGVGHSAGGQLFGLASNNQRLSALLTVGAQHGYWALWPGLRKFAMALLWWIAIPLVTRLFGYFPSRLLGLGAELPKGVALEWASWCRDPAYVNGRHRPPAADAFAAFTGPLRAYSFSDDAYAPPISVDRLAAFYSAATLERRNLTPRDLGVAAIGHFGFFRDDFRSSLWSEAADWLLRH